MSTLHTWMLQKLNYYNNGCQSDTLKTHQTIYALRNTYIAFETIILFSEYTASCTNHILSGYLAEFKIRTSWIGFLSIFKSVVFSKLNHWNFMNLELSLCKKGMKKIISIISSLNIYVTQFYKLILTKSKWSLQISHLLNSIYCIMIIPLLINIWSDS